MQRRNFFKACAGLSIAAVDITANKAVAAKPKKPEKMRPQVGDYLVHYDIEEGIKPILVSEMVLDAEQVMAFPQDSNSKVVRDGSRFNKVMIIRLDPKQMDEKTRANSVNGIVAYSAICTHQGCDVNSYLKDKKEFFCFCHMSRFDPLKTGNVTNGPATRKLAMLPIEQVGDQLIVRKQFTRKPGPTK
jgi:rieske iron-sulfur protein